MRNLCFENIINYNLKSSEYLFLIKSVNMYFFSTNKVFIIYFNVNRTGYIYVNIMPSIWVNYIK